eukprot:scaffold35107_cov28-Tisochrysis_lutea.AAC.6
MSAASEQLGTSAVTEIERDCERRSITLSGPSRRSMGMGREARVTVTVTGFEKTPRKLRTTTEAENLYPGLDSVVRSEPLSTAIRLP